MSVEHLIDSYSSTGDMISFVSCVALLLVVRWVLYFSQDKKFALLKKSVHFIMCGTLSNLGFFAVCKTGLELDLFLYFFRSVYHFCFICCMYLFMLYLEKMLSVEGLVVTIVTWFTRIFFVISVLLDVLSPITGFGFHKEGKLWFDPIISPYNIFYVYAMLLLFVMLVFYSKRMVKSVRYCLIATEILCLILMTYCAIANCNTFTSYTYVLTIIVVMILLHSRPFDDSTGALSVDSLKSYVNQNGRQGKAADYMILKLNLNVINKIPVELGKVLNSFWRDSFRNAILFNMEDDLFVLAIPRTERNGDTVSKIKQLFEHDFMRYYAKYQIQYKVIGIVNADFIQNDSDLRRIINYMLFTMSENTMIITDQKMRRKLRALRETMEILVDIDAKQDLNDPRVLVYCQPIRNMKTGKFDTAEALMRIAIPGKELIKPSLFIPLAEYYGHVHILSKIILNKVCAQIKQFEEEGYQFSRISVNTAASEIRSESFCEDIIKIVKQNGINPEKLGVELTETQNESDFQIVKDKMGILKEQGMTLYLDDVGTGYSNLDRIVRYDVDVVKFDRFFLLEAEKNPKVVHMMKHLSEAFRDLNYKLLYEGVETEEHEQLCLQCGADYIQGFKYSKPIPIEQMRDFFAQKDAQ